MSFVSMDHGRMLEDARDSQNHVQPAFLSHEVVQDATVKRARMSPHPGSLDSSSAFSVETGRPSRRRREPRVAAGYSCDFCSKVFDLDAERKKHMRSSHIPEKDRPYPCQICHKRFNWRKDLRRHQRSIHRFPEGADDNILSGLPPPSSVTDLHAFTGAWTIQEGHSMIERDIDPSLISEFTYSPLDDRNARQIRLVELLPSAHKDAPIRCRLSTHQLDETPYEALSYTWGNSLDTHIITLNDQKMSVGANLCLALQNLRQVCDVRWLWVDAICINQGDNRERASQVAMMADIYSSAIKTIVWLGEHSDNSALAVDFAKNVGSLYMHGSLTNDPACLNGWSAFAMLMKRPWFSRRWIIQEIALATDATLYCGHDSLPWRDFQAAVSLSQTGIFKTLRDTSQAFGVDDLSNIEQHGAARLVNILGSVCRFDSRGKVAELCLTLTDLMSALWFCECSDPRDMIYALLGLAKDSRELHERYRLKWPEQPIPTLVSTFPKAFGNMAGLQASVVVDYSLSQAELSRHILKLDCKGEAVGNLDVLCRPWGTWGAEADLPSWVPDWRTTPFQLVHDHIRRRNGDLLVGTTSRDGPYYNACSSMTAKYGRDWGFYDDEYSVALLSDLSRRNSSHGNLTRLYHTVAAHDDFHTRPLHPAQALSIGQSRNVQSTWRQHIADSHLPECVELSFQAAACPVSPDGVNLNVKNNATQRPEAAQQFQSCEDRRDSLFVTGFDIDTIGEVLDASQRGNITEEWLDLGGYDPQNRSASEQLWRTLVADRGPNGTNPPQYYQVAFENAVELCGGRIDTESLKENSDPAMKDFLSRVESVVWNRRLFRSSRHQRLGLCPKASRPDDVLCIVAGMSVPVVLRPVGPGHYRLIGECYLHDMMDGQAVHMKLHSHQGHEEDLSRDAKLPSVQMEKFLIV